MQLTSNDIIFLERFLKAQEKKCTMNVVKTTLSEELLELFELSSGAGSRLIGNVNIKLVPGIVITDPENWQ